MDSHIEVKAKNSPWNGIKKYIAENKFLTFICIVIFICEYFDVISMATTYFWIAYLSLWSIMNDFDSSRSQFLSKLDYLRSDIDTINDSIQQLRSQIDRLIYDEK
jgi:hypothetical protein